MHRAEPGPAATCRVLFPRRPPPRPESNAEASSLSEEAPSEASFAPAASSSDPRLPAPYSLSSSLSRPSRKRVPLFHSAPLPHLPRDLISITSLIAYTLTLSLNLGHCSSLSPLIGAHMRTHTCTHTRAHTPPSALRVSFELLCRPLPLTARPLKNERRLSHSSSHPNRSP